MSYCFDVDNGPEWESVNRLRKGLLLEGRNEGRKERADGCEERRKEEKEGGMGRLAEEDR